MATRYTSSKALAEIVGRLGGLRLEVYRAVAGWDATVLGPGPSIEDLAGMLKRKEGSICGRLNELRQAGAIELGPFKYNALTGSEALTYIALEFREPPPRAVNGQLDLFGDVGQRRGPGAYSTA